MNNNLTSLLVGILTVVLLVLLLDPFMVWMPTVTQMFVLILLTASLCVWSALIISERARDERELGNALYASRVGYVSGIAVLTIALVVQGLAHSIDMWITLALGVMVVSKLVARWYGDRHR